MKTNEEYLLLEKHNVLLRDALQHNLNAPGEPDAVDEGFAAIAATADLAGLILCDAEPFAVMNKTILYKAKEKS